MRLRLERLARLLLAAGLLSVPPSFADAQQSVDLWQDLTNAGAQEKLESAVTPILLGHALKIAERDDKFSARSMLTRTQLLLSYVFMDQFELFKAVYGLVPRNVDMTKFDRALAEYIPTTSLLRGLYYDRWTQPRESDDALRIGAAGIAASRLSNIDVSLRRKFAPQDALGLADALVNRGLVFKNDGDPKSATDDYQAALDLFAATRRDRNALEKVDDAFDVGSPPSDAGRGDAADLQSATEDFVAASTEPYLPITIITATVAGAEDAIENGQATLAEHYLHIMSRADAQSARISRFVIASWPCHADLAQIYFWRAALDSTRMKFAEKFGQAASDEKGKYFDGANKEFRTALEIGNYSAGSATLDFKAMVQRYEQFLKESGNASDATRLDETVKSLDPASIGEAGPQDWRSVLDCVARSR